MNPSCCSSYSILNDFRVAKVLRSKGAKVRFWKLRSFMPPWRLAAISVRPDSKLDESVVEAIVTVKYLFILDLSFSNCDDESLKKISLLPRLGLLVLTGTQITSQSVETILKMKQLSFLSVIETALTNDDVIAVREGLPECNVMNLRFESKNVEK